MQLSLDSDTILIQLATFFGNNLLAITLDATSFDRYYSQSLSEITATKSLSCPPITLISLPILVAFIIV